MSEFVNDILRFCSFDTWDGSINVFNNFSKKLGELRSKVAEIGANVAKEVFEAGSEAVKSVRDSLVSAFGIDPSRLDAGNAASNMGGQSKAAQSAMSGMPKINNLVGGGSKSISDTDDSSKAKATAQQKFAQDMQRQRNAAQ